jgi:hypothetical protein
LKGANIWSIIESKKMFVFVTEGKLLGHVVSKGVYIDPERIKSINDLNPPTSKKGVQSFFGKIILLDDLSPIMLPLSSL